jgi:hypothetical protein
MGGPVADARLALAAGLAVALGLAGCTDGPTVNRPDGRPTDGGTVTAAAVRTDRDPITKRFPKLGNFVEVHWQGSLVGSSDVPGPSDVLIQALVVLRPEERAVAKAGYDWVAAPTGWEARMSDELRPFAPASGDWQHNRQYELDVRTSRYSGAVYLDMVSGTVFLDVNSS